MITITMLHNKEIDKINVIGDFNLKIMGKTGFIAFNEYEIVIQKAWTKIKLE
ncbi:hypothetical protein [Aliicoccus persicus]|uniref:hypothetical protein n=1 Tax=Aliicoccus persicus TaxID=930138 RepID=UPI0015D667B8|nr:hypothetical protein [Aliicoccus persicus]